jgi:hypothetical protein
MVCIWLTFGCYAGFILVESMEGLDIDSGITKNNWTSLSCIPTTTHIMIYCIHVARKPNAMLAANNATQ